MNVHISYPQYRKYKNGKAYFMIPSNKEWEELQLIGSKVLLHRFTVNILPDRNFIHDMTFDFQEHWESITEQEYLEQKAKAIQ